MSLPKRFLTLHRCSIRLRSGTGCFRDTQGAMASKPGSPPKCARLPVGHRTNKGDQPIAGRRVWEHNNLAQKNLTIVDMKPNTWFVLPFVVSNLHSLVKRGLHLELIRPKDSLKLEASLMHSSQEVFKRLSNVELTRFEVRPSAIDDDTTEGLDCAGQVLSQIDHEVGLIRMLTSDQPELLEKRFPQGVEVKFAGGATARLLISVRPQEQLTFGLRLRLPPDVRKGDVLHLDLIQRNVRGRRILGWYCRPDQRRMTAHG